MTDALPARAQQTPDVPILSVRGVRKQYATARGESVALDDVTFDVRASEFVSIVGPSGCGKTTLLNCVAGLLTPTSGTVAVHGEEVWGKVPHNLGIVFQDYSRSLFPWMPIERNIALPARRSGQSKRQILAEVRALLDAVGLPPDVAGRYPWQLSGGMQQRVAIARALISRPELLLMDEPFASVDAQTRMTLEDLTLDVWSRWRKSIVFVTHDIDEAVYLSDRIVILTAGPSRVRDVVDVQLPRPRHQIDTKLLPAFADIRASVMAQVMSIGRKDPTGADDH